MMDNVCMYFFILSFLHGKSKLNKSSYFFLSIIKLYYKIYIFH